MVTNYRNHGASYSNNILATALIIVYFEFELITGQAAMADLSRGTAHAGIQLHGTETSYS